MKRSPQNVWNWANKRFQEQLKLAEQVGEVYEDWDAADRIRTKAWNDYCEAIPELGELRHASSHDRGGIYEGRQWACPRCRAA